MRLTELQSFKGAKNKHPTTRCVCACGRERIVRTTRLRTGRVTQCATCAHAAGAKAGAEKRQLPADVALTRKTMGTYLANARARGLVFELNEQQVAGLLRTVCEYCGTQPAPIGGIDRRDNNEGYTLANSAPCCSTCNYAKRDMPASAFLAWIERAHAHGLLQRDRQVRSAVVAQPDGRGSHHGRSGR
jgi:hypothetical protein